MVKSLRLPLALAALNQQPSHAAAPAFARVLAEMFGPDPKAAAIGIPNRPLDAMYAEPARGIRPPNSAYDSAAHALAIPAMMNETETAGPA